MSTDEIISMKKRPNTKTHDLGPLNISLENVLSYDIEIEINPNSSTSSSGNKKRGRKITLYGVPLFLVEAFTWLENKNAFNIEGIFRKEGSAIRMRNPWQIFCGLSRIPDTYTVHDVCTLIKRFFSALKRPILGDHQSNIMSNVSTLNNERVQAESVLMLVDLLPLTNQATLCYLMRQLKKISELSSTNQMTIANLGIVFAPAIFSDPIEMRPSSSIWGTGSSCCLSSTSTSSVGISGSSGSGGGRDSSSYYSCNKNRPLSNIANIRKKKFTGSQESLKELDFVKRRQSLQASVVSLLIQYANHLCIPRILPPISRGFLHRKSSDCSSFLLQQQQLLNQQVKSSSILSNNLNKNEQQNKQPSTSLNIQVNERQSRGLIRGNNSNNSSNKNTPHKERRKIWPRSSSENPFQRTRALFGIIPSFGKNGLFIPRETNTKTPTTPKVHQNRLPIHFCSPEMNLNQQNNKQPASIQFLSPTTTATSLK